MPSNTDSRVPIGLSVLSVFIVAYSLIIAQQILLGVLAAGLPWFVYMLYLLVSSLTRIASALERIAAQRTENQRSEAGDER